MYFSFMLHQDIFQEGQDELHTSAQKNTNTHRHTKDKIQYVYLTFKTGLYMMTIVLSQIERGEKASLAKKELRFRLNKQAKEKKNI